MDADWVFANHYVFSWNQKLTFNTHKTLQKWAKSSGAETASSKRRPVQPPLPFYGEDAQTAKKWQANNVLPPRRLIVPSLLTTKIVARSKHSSSKKFLLHKKLPKPPKGASKLTSFRAILAVRMHAAVRAEGLLAPSSARFSVDRRCRLCKGLGSLLSYPLLVATLCFNPAKGPQTTSRSAECRGRATMYTGTGSTHCWSAAVHRTSTSLWLSNSYSCEFGFVCQWWLLFSSFQCGYGAFDLFFPIPKSNSASRYANDDGQRPTSIVDLTARVPCRFFYFRGARQLWAIYRQPLACHLLWKRRKHQQTDIQNSKVSSSHSIVDQAVRIALLTVFGRSAAMRQCAIWRWRRDFP